MEQTNHWGLALGIVPVPKELSERKRDSSVNVTLVDDDLEIYVDDDIPKNTDGRYMHLHPKQKSDLINDITKHLKAGAKTGPDVLKQLEIDGRIPVHEATGKLLMARSIYRYVRIIKVKLGINPEPLMTTEVVKLYKSGTTNRQQIMKTVGCGYSCVRKALLRHGLIKKVRNVKKSRKL